MADKRPFFKLDVGYFGNPKIQSLMDDRPRAILLHLECIAYSRQHLTDGLVPVRIAMRTVCASQEDRIALTDSGLLIDIDATTVRVHDYSEHNQTASEVNRRSQAGSVGAAARWASEPHCDSHQQPHANRNAEKRREDLVPEPQRGDVDQLCQEMYLRLIANGRKNVTITKSWRTEARLLLDRDGRPLDEAIALIRWCQQDTFWKANIGGLPKFREKYDQLRLKSGIGRFEAAQKSPDGWMNA